MLIGHTADGFRIRFPRLADFEVSASGTAIVACPSENVSPSTLRHLLLDQVIPLGLSQNNCWVLHSSAVLDPAGRALMFAAPSGYGKSTLAGVLAKAGGRLMSDDGNMLKSMGGRLHCIPGYTGVRLCSDSASELFGIDAPASDFAQYSEKVRLALADNQINVNNAPVPLSRVYCLTPPDDSEQIVISPLPAREAFIELVKYSFTLDVRNPLRLRTNFQHFADMATLPIYFRLQFPRQWNALPHVVRAIWAHAAEQDSRV